MLVSAQFSAIFLSETKRLIGRLDTPKKMELVLNLPQEGASLAIDNLAEMFQRLGTEIDTKTGNTILHQAVLARKAYLIVDLLKLKGLDVNARNYDNYTAFAIAAETGQSDIIAKLLEASDIIIKNGNGEPQRTALELANFNGHMEIAIQIIGSRLWYKEKEDVELSIQLRCAAKRGNVKKVNILLQERHININSASEDGDTPLMLAILAQKYDVAKILLTRNDINVLAINDRGLTALHLAMVRKEGDEKIVHILLSRGFDGNKKSIHGVTPLDIAKAIGFEAGVNALLGYPGIVAGLKEDEKRV